MKSILLLIRPDNHQEERLQCALDLARAFDGHISCVQVTPFDHFIGGDPFGGMHGCAELMAKLRTEEKAERERVEAHLAREGASWDWLHFDGNAVQTVLSQSRLADVIVLSQAIRGKTEGIRPLPIAAEVAIHARAPVMAVPAIFKGLGASGTAMVAWNGSFEAAQALRLALPMLRGAGKVCLVEVTDDMHDFPATEAASYLSRHGIAAELHQWRREGRSTADVLLDAAAQLRAGYVVMGAYGHSRVRETVIGGVTRDLISGSAIPLLLAH